MKVNKLPKSLIIGGANLDITGSCDARLIPGDSNPGVVKSCPGGVGRNIAENLARLGLPCAMITAVGDDLGRQMIMKNCQEVGINTEHFLVHPESSTGTYVAINNQLGALLAAIADMSITEKITPEALAERHEFICQQDQLILDANLSEASLKWLAKQYSNKPIFVDAVSATKAPKIASILNSISVLKVNRDEAAALLNQYGDDIFLAKKLFEKGVKKVVLSQGPQGALVYSNQGLIQRPAIKGNNASDTGAGDALFAGFIAAQNILHTLEHQLEFAIACGTETLNCRVSVNPKLSIDLIRTLYFKHLNKNNWLIA